MTAGEVGGSEVTVVGPVPSGRRFEESGFVISAASKIKLQKAIPRAKRFCAHRGFPNQLPTIPISAAVAIVTIAYSNVDGILEIMPRRTDARLVSASHNSRWPDAALSALAFDAPTQLFAQ